MSIGSFSVAIIKYPGLDTKNRGFGDHCLKSGAPNGMPQEFGEGLQASSQHGVGYHMVGQIWCSISSTSSFSWKATNATTVDPSL